MRVKSHYDNHLGAVYSWMTGDFQQNKNRFKTFCQKNNILPINSLLAIDLGAGHGIQSVALAELGFTIQSIDFNHQLLNELEKNKGTYPIDIINEDIRLVKKYWTHEPELVVCCGDTITHLDSIDEIQQLIQDISAILLPEGKIVLSFRDYSQELQDTQRFIPVKSDEKRIITCFLEYFSDKIRVSDLVYEYENGEWVQKVSSYEKIRIYKNQVIEYLEDAGFQLILDQTDNRFIFLVGTKIEKGN